MKSRFITISLVLALCLGFWLRLRGITSPLADWHSWRQADTASVGREYVKHGIDLLHPTYHDLSSLPSGKDNPAGYRMVEFPVVNALVAAIYRAVPLVRHYEIHVVYRFINVLFSLASAGLLYLIIKRLESPFTGLLAATAFLLLPYNIFYSRTILPEVAMITTSLAGVYFCLRYLDSHQVVDAIGFVVFAALALLVKPVAIFLLIPLVPLIMSKRGMKIVSWQWVAMAAVTIAPLFLWRRWIQGFPEGIPASSWLLNGNGIRLKGAFFQWLFADRIGRIILGYWGLIPLGLGLLAPKKSSFVFWLMVSSVGYLVVFATGNVQHDYYQIPLVPIISILIAYGIQYLRRLPGSSLAKYAVLSVSLNFMFMFSWYHVRTLYGINNPAIVTAGAAVDKLTPPDALVIAPYMGDTAFLYQTNRRGWPIGFNIDERIKQGAHYYVSTAYDDEARALEAKYTTIEKTDQYILIDLTKPKI